MEKSVRHLNQAFEIKTSNNKTSWPYVPPAVIYWKEHIAYLMLFPENI